MNQIMSYNICVYIPNKPYIDTLKLTIVKGHLCQNKRTIGISQCVHKRLEEGYPSALFGNLYKFLEILRKIWKFVLLENCTYLQISAKNIFPFPIRKVGNRIIITVVLV